MNQKILIVIPVFNEAPVIKSVLCKVSKLPAAYDLLVINDGSTDSTESILRELDVNHLQFPYNTGYGCAIQAGFKYAAKHNYDFVVHLDGDGQHETAHIPEFVESLMEDQADIIIGSRFLTKNADYNYNISAVRLFFVIVLRTLIKVFTRISISDPTSGFIGINRNALHYLVREEYPFDYPDADVIIAMHRNGLRIVEIPVVMYNANGKSKLHSGSKPVYYVFKMLLGILISVLRVKHRKTKQ